MVAAFILQEGTIFLTFIPSPGKKKVRNEGLKAVDNSTNHPLHSIMCYFFHFTDKEMI